MATDSGVKGPPYMATEPGRKVSSMTDEAASQSHARNSFNFCKSGRAKAQVRQELEREMSKLASLHTLANAEREKHVKQNLRIERVKARWKSDHPGEPFDPEEFGGNLQPYVMNDRIIHDHWQQHYVVAALEDELEGKTDV